MDLQSGFGFITLAMAMFALPEALYLVLKPAPESANHAACTGSFVPLLTLGIPGSGTTAILLGALLALNITPGPRLMIDAPQVFWSVIISMYIGNLVLLILNLPLIPYIAQGAFGTQKLPDSLYPFLYTNGCLYRPKQCD